MVIPTAGLAVGVCAGNVLSANHSEAPIVANSDLDRLLVACRLHSTVPLRNDFARDMHATRRELARGADDSRTVTDCSFRHAGNLRISIYLDDEPTSKMAFARWDETNRQTPVAGVPIRPLVYLRRGVCHDKRHNAGVAVARAQRGDDVIGRCPRCEPVALPRTGSSHIIFRQIEQQHVWTRLIDRLDVPEEAVLRERHLVRRNQVVARPRRRSILVISGLPP